MQATDVQPQINLSALSPASRQELIDFYHFLCAKQKAENKNSLLSLAGTWTDSELDEFNQATESFNQIDEALWK